MTDPRIAPDASPASASPTHPADEMANDAQAALMKQKMQDDVASWAASRADAPSQALVTPPATTRQHATKDPAKPVAARTVKAAVNAPSATVAKPGKPFSMAYDGRPAGKYAAERFDRGAR